MAGESTAAQALPATDAWGMASRSAATAPRTAPWSAASSASAASSSASTRSVRATRPCAAGVRRTRRPSRSSSGTPASRSSCNSDCEIAEGVYPTNLATSAIVPRRASSLRSRSLRRSSMFSSAYARIKASVLVLGLPQAQHASCVASRTPTEDPPQTERYEPMPGIAELPGWLWRRTGRAAQLALLGLLIVLLATAAALVPVILESKEERAESDRRERAERRAELIRRLETEQRPRHRRSPPSPLPRRQPTSNSKPDRR